MAWPPCLVTLLSTRLTLEPQPVLSEAAPADSQQPGQVQAVGGLLPLPQEGGDSWGSLGWESKCG